MIHRLFMVATAVVLLGFVRPAPACTVPVFRYALEQWPPDLFETFVFYEDQTNEAITTFVDALESAARTGPNYANVRPVLVAVTNGVAETAQEIWDQVKTNDLPLATAVFPRNDVPAWWGMPTPKNARRLVDSPVRRTVFRHILKGASAVWVLLESGIPDKDEQTYGLLTNTLSRLEKELELPEILDVDREEYTTADGPELMIRFPVVRLSRTNDEESIFVHMLMQTKEGLPSDEPVAFPIFGQGRMLEAFHGKVLDNSIIAEACAFLVGNCSCEVKSINPGVDLLFSAGWDELIHGSHLAVEAVPELIGIPEFEYTNDAPSQTVSISSSEMRGSREKTPSPLLRTMTVVIALAGICVVIASIVISRKRVGRN